ncbi:hypothetical protein NIB75_18700 [Bacteroides uniformis]|nr:hypothetical protein [Bacteroides uniformis]
MSQPVPADVIVEEVAGIRRVVIHRDNTVPVLAGRDHLRLGGVSVSRRPFLEDSRVDELRFRDIQFIAHFEQDAPRVPRAAACRRNGGSRSHPRPRRGGCRNDGVARAA